MSQSTLGNHCLEFKMFPTKKPSPESDRTEVQISEAVSSTVDRSISKNPTPGASTSREMLSRRWRPKRSGFAIHIIRTRNIPATLPKRSLHRLLCRCELPAIPCSSPSSIGPILHYHAQARPSRRRPGVNLGGLPTHTVSPTIEIV